MRCTYARELKAELDGFLRGELPKQHTVDVVYDELSGMVQIDLTTDGNVSRPVTVVTAGSGAAAQLEETRKRLRKKRSQWVYFDRNLRIYEGTRTFTLKPMQRFHWTQTQARLDAREIIGETLNGGD